MNTSKRHWHLRWLTICLAVFVGLTSAVLASGCGSGAGGQTAKVTPTPTTAKSTGGEGSSEPSAGQKNALESAKQYLETQAFSRKGLIEQLSSKYGEGYSKADATWAVDHLKVNWNEQAYRAAKEYLDTMPFSRAGLIQQLESPAGGGFTHAQAVYGATKAGL